jgi:hypothetical protein
MDDDNDEDRLPVDDGYPSYDSIVVPVPECDILPTREEEEAEHVAYLAQIAVHEARLKKEREIKETPLEAYKRVSTEKEVKAVKAVKASAKKWAKRNKITSHFRKK